MSRRVASLSVQENLSAEQYDLINAFANATMEFHEDEVKQLMKDDPLMTRACALDISYLRTRSRWTADLEKRLYKEHQQGKTINISDWPNHSNKGYDPFTGKPLEVSSA